jgi:CheY-like chemotaxis protein/HPt (histidine-containing phosphotransfer) domain-containing protein
LLSSPQPDVHSPRRRVLVVDDHPVNRLVTVAQVTALGYAADAADSGERALAALAEKPYDAVLLDCEMPELDGYETCRRLRWREGDGRRTRVIALTAHSSLEEREKCLAAGMDDHLAKSARLEELAAALQRCLDGEDAEAVDGRPDIERLDAKRLEERLQALARLGRETGKEILEQVVESYLRQGAKDLEALRRTLALGDGGAFAAAAHSLAGSSGILGATGLAASCAQLEALARRADLAACEARLKSVEQAFQSIARRLSA